MADIFEGRRGMDGSSSAELEHAVESLLDLGEIACSPSDQLLTSAGFLYKAIEEYASWDFVGSAVDLETAKEIFDDARALGDRCWT